ncbi:MAG: cohesin domain-containing protein, partial [Bacteroidota bacterium]
CQGASVVLNANTGAGFTYQWRLNGNAINGATAASYSANTAGAYSVVVTNSSEGNGCSATSAVVNVIVKPNSSTTINAEICQGQTYTFGTQSLSTSGTYTRTVPSANGCDSIITLNLNVKPTAASSITASICQGQTYTFGSQTLTSSGTYTRNIIAANGCDSVITLALTVRSNASSNIAVAICQGQSYTFGNLSLTSSGNFTRTIPSANGCDSTINLDLLVNPTYAQSIQASILFGNSYAFNGQNLTSPGTYTANLLTVKGCDSIITLNLNVLAQSGVSIANATTCQGDTVIVPVTINQGVGISAISLAINYNPAGLTFIGSQNINPSIASILIGTNNFGGLNQVRASWSDINPVSLSGTAFELKFLAQNNSSLQFDLANPGNCELADSVGNPIPQVTFTGGNVSAISASYATSTISIPFGNVYSVCGQSFNASGTYTVICNNAAFTGCDSIITLNLTVGSAPITSISNVSGCVGDTVSVPVVVNNLNGIGAISLALNYNASALSFIGFENANPAIQSSNLLVNAGVFAGQSQERLSWFNANPINLGNSPVTLVNYRFVVNASSTLAWDLATAGNCEY